ncbi:MAG: DUF2281 domain-containing protein [Candidatus Kuenenia sp.]|nr:DUF2281 domain-containing protein [Candidatus Kuenenia hertensis]
MRLSDKELTEVVSEKMKELSDDTIKEVIDFIEFLKSKKTQGEKGSPEKVLQHLGTWKFEKGEIDKILEDIQTLREIEV